MARSLTSKSIVTIKLNMYLKLLKYPLLFDMEHQQKISNLNVNILLRSSEGAEFAKFP